MTRLVKYSLALAFSVASLALSACNGARDTALDLVGKNGDKGFSYHEITRGSRTRKYATFVPHSYNNNNKYPVIIFLHGVGEGGSSCRANLQVGLAPFVADLASRFNFIVIFPQSDSGHWDPDGENANDVIAELEAVAKMYPAADMNRVSLTGLSTGGYGTWAIGAKYANRFAALVPMGSSASCTDQASKLVNMPIRSYHNNGDWAAAMWNDEMMVDKINSLGGRAELFKTNGPGHNCWEIAYGETDLFQWLAQQQRPAGARAAAPAPTPVAAPAAAPAPSPSYSSSPVRANSASSISNTPY
jgi:predicted peptidase